MWSHSTEEFQRGFEQGDGNLHRFLEARASNIAAELGRPPPINDDDLKGILRHLCAFARRKGPGGEQKRWMAAWDTARANVDSRYTRMFWVDLVAMTLSSSPHRIDNVHFSDDLGTVFQKTHQSIKAACHILRDDKMFQASNHNKQTGCCRCLLRAFACVASAAGT